MCNTIDGGPCFYNLTVGIVDSEGNIWNDSGLTTIGCTVNIRVIEDLDSHLTESNLKVDGTGFSFLINRVKLNRVVWIP